MFDNQFKVTPSNREQVGKFIDDMKEAIEKHDTEAQLQREIERDLRAAHSAIARKQRSMKTCTYQGWIDHGRQVKSGERCTKVLGVAVFHVSQTVAID